VGTMEGKFGVPALSTRSVWSRHNNISEFPHHRMRSVFEMQYVAVDQPLVRLDKVMDPKPICLSRSSSLPSNDAHEDGQSDHPDVVTVGEIVGLAAHFDM